MTTEHLWFSTALYFLGILIGLVVGALMGETSVLVGVGGVVLGAMLLSGFLSIYKVVRR